MRKPFNELRKYVHQSNLVEGFNDEYVDALAITAWEHLRERTENGKPLTHDIIQDMQRRMTDHQAEMHDNWRGAYRDRSRQRVWVGGREAMHPSLVGMAMDEWLERLPERTPKENHIAFEYIHPFVDGNGRVGRMLMWWQELNLGQKPTLINKSEVEEYYAWFTSTGSGAQ